MKERYSLPELYMLLNPETAQGEKLYRLTLYSLLARDILAINIVMRKPTKHDSFLVKYVFVGKGVNYDGYNPKIFEKDLIDLVDNGEEQIRFFIAKCFFRFEDYDNYKKEYFYKPLIENSLINEQNLWLSLFSDKNQLSSTGQIIKSKLVKSLTLGDSIIDSIDKMPVKDAERYILDLASIFLISDAVTDKKLFEKFNALSRKSDRSEQKEILSINAKETIDLWQSISSDLKFKKEDLEEIFAFNPHYFDADAIIALLGSTSGYSFGF